MNREEIITQYVPSAEELDRFNAKWEDPDYRALMIGVCSSTNPQVVLCARSVCFGDQADVQHDIPGSRYTLMDHLLLEVDLLPLAIRAGAYPDDVFIGRAKGDVAFMTPLGAAAKEGRVDVCVELLELGCDPDYDNTYRSYFTPLCLAVIAQNRDVVELLLEWGADPNADSNADSSHDCDLEDCCTPLEEACMGADEGIVNVLLAHGANPHTVGASALALSPSAERLESFILSTGYSLSAPRGERCSLVYVLAREAFCHRWEPLTHQVAKVKAAVALGGDLSLAAEFEAHAREAFL